MSQSITDELHARFKEIKKRQKDMGFSHIDIKQEIPIDIIDEIVEKEGSARASQLIGLSDEYEHYKKLLYTIVEKNSF